MLRTFGGRAVSILLLSVLALPATAAETKAAGQGKVEGTFVVGGVDAERGHANAKSGRFGVIMEVKVESFKVTGDRLSAHIRTVREQEFTQDKYRLDLTFEAPIEKR